MRALHQLAPCACRQLYERMEGLAAAFMKCGVAAGDTVCQFADNSSRWLVADQAIMLCACINAVRGAGAPEDELLRITDVAAPRALVLQDRAAFERLAPHIGSRIRGVKFVMLLWDDVTPEMRAAVPIPVYSYIEVRPLSAVCARALLFADCAAVRRASSVRQANAATACVAHSSSISA